MSFIEPNHFSVSVDDRLSEDCKMAPMPGLLLPLSAAIFVVEADDCKSDCDQCCDDDLDNNSLS